MLIKLPEWIEINENLKVPHRGKVVDNIDPDKQGRVKLEIVGLIQGSKDKLPWTYPINPHFLGGLPGVGEFSVPEIGSELIVEFPFEDIYFPFYTGYWHTKSNYNHGTFSGDYPNTFGWVDSTGTFWRVNKTQKKVEFSHVSGAKVSIDSSGNINVDSPATITVKAASQVIVKAPKIMHN